MLNHSVCNLLCTFVFVLFITTEFSHLLIGHDIPDTVWCKYYEFRCDMQIILRIENELANFWFCYDSGFLSKNVTHRSRHGQAWVGLIVDPHSQRPWFLAWLRRCNGVNTLDCLDHESLGVSVVDLTVIVVQDSFCLIWKVGFVISCLCHDDNRVISLATSLTTMQVFWFLIVRLTNNYRSRVSAVTEDEGILLLVACYESASTQFAVKLILFLQFLLDCQESRACGFLDIFK